LLTYDDIGIVREESGASIRILRCRALRKLCGSRHYVRRWSKASRSRSISWRSHLGNSP